MSRLLELSAAYARLTLQSGLLSEEKLLAGTGLDVETLSGLDYIDWQPLAAMFRNLDSHLESPAWAARIGAQFNITAHGPLGFAALSAPTLGAALDVMATLYPARTSAMVVDIERRDGRYTLHLLDLTGDAQFHRWMSELILKVLESLLSAILGHPTGFHVLIRMAAPSPFHAEELIAAYDARVVFDAASYAISIPEAWRNLPSPLHDESVYRTNVIKCREIIAAREQQDNAAAVLRNLLSNHFDRIIARETDAAPPPTQEAVAASIHLTTRTLIRRLKAQNTSYKEILQELRRHYASTLLGDARLTVADVGETIGYREPANFGRAFRRWYGVSPAAWRRQGGKSGVGSSGTIEIGSI
jgi:AraC-like DNA-binding protein